MVETRNNQSIFMKENKLLSEECMYSKQLKSKYTKENVALTTYSSKIFFNKNSSAFLPPVSHLHKIFRIVSYLQIHKIRIILFISQLIVGKVEE